MNEQLKKTMKELRDQLDRSFEAGTMEQRDYAKFQRLIDKALVQMFTILYQDNFISEAKKDMAPNEDGAWNLDWLFQDWILSELELYDVSSVDYMYDYWRN
jgi:hypothetical protein